MLNSNSIRFWTSESQLYYKLPLFSVPKPLWKCSSLGYVNHFHPFHFRSSSTQVFDLGPCNITSVIQLVVLLPNCTSVLQPKCVVPAFAEIPSDILIVVTLESTVSSAHRHLWSCKQLHLRSCHEHEACVYRGIRVLTLVPLESRDSLPW